MSRKESTFTHGTRSSKVGACDHRATFLGSLFVVDHALTQLRLRGVDSDLISLRRERVSILKILGRTSLARMEERKLRGTRGSEPGLDPEPGGFLRAKTAFEDLLRQFSRGTEECEDWENGLERIALEALRLRIQLLSLRIQLARTPVLLTPIQKH